MIRLTEIRRVPQRLVATCSLLAISASLSLCGSVAAQADEPVRLRVLSYNIHHGEGIDGKLDLKRLADVIVAAKPDVVALQEVDVETERTGKVDQAAELARLTGMHVAFGSAMKYQGGEYGNAVLSRFEIAATKVHALPSLDDGEPRAVLEAELSVPGLKAPLRFFATHFDYRKDPQERIASVAAIEKWLEALGDSPAVLAGDLNDVRESEPLKRLETKWTIAGETEAPTIPVKDPARQIDFILFRPAKNWNAIEVRVLDEAVASDHRAILAVLEWSP